LLLIYEIEVLFIAYADLILVYMDDKIIDLKISVEIKKSYQVIFT